MSDNGGKFSVILLGHGSRVPDASRGLEKIAEELRSSGDYQMVEVCYMSRCKPDFPSTLKKCAEAGAGKVVLIPYFLHLGLHMRLDIPEMMQAEAAKYPDVKLVFGKHLGYDNSLAGLVRMRIEESENIADVREMKLEPRENYPLAEGEMEFVAMSPEEAARFCKGHGHHH